jgi:hypothetical protein
VPTTLAAVTVLVLAVVPGMIGVYAFATINGTDWRHKDWQVAVRALSFSVFGLLVYSLLALSWDWIPPLHVIPSSYRPDWLRASKVAGLLLPFAGHCVSSGIVGGVAAGLDRCVAKISRASPHVCAWDDFVGTRLADRWVVITLASSDVYAGYVALADVGVPATDRDIILTEPARFDPETRQYVVTSYRHMFIRAELVQSIATVALPTDAPIGQPIGQPLFKPHDTERKEATAAEAGPRPAR